MDKVRLAAMEIVEEIDKGGAYSTILFNRRVKELGLDDLDRGLMTELVYGTLQRKLTLDYYMQPYVKGKLQSWVRNLLRTAFYQLIYLDRIPDHAVLFETVEIAKKRGHKGLGNLVNGILRAFLRNPRPKLEEIEPVNQGLSIQYSMPVWLVDRFLEDYGLDKTEAILSSLLNPPFMAARIQDLSESREQVIADLEAEGFKAWPSEVYDRGIRIASRSVVTSKLFEQGRITIQDESSMLVAALGAIEPQDLVLDACAAPGGKTTHMASFISEEKNGKIIALDIHKHKVKLIEENAERLHVNQNIQAQVLDARKAYEIFEPQSFDKIFVDAPCSGLGLMRRKPDIKYSKKAEDITKLHDIQVEILNSLADLVKKGGRLIYSTCTLTSEENSRTVSRFLQAHPDFTIEPIIEWPHLEKCIQADGSIQLLPQDFGTDGFYICRLKRRD